MCGVTDSCSGGGGGSSSSSSSSSTKNKNKYMLAFGFLFSPLPLQIQNQSLHHVNTTCCGLVKPAFNFAISHIQSNSLKSNCDFINNQSELSLFSYVQCVKNG